MTDEQRDAYERGIVDLGKKEARAKAPWIAAAHKHSAEVLKSIIPAPEPDPTNEELAERNEAHERRSSGTE